MTDHPMMMIDMTAEDSGDPLLPLKMTGGTDQGEMDLLMTAHPMTDPHMTDLHMMIMTGEDMDHQGQYHGYILLLY